MTFDSYWLRLQVRNPQLTEGGKLTIATEAFQRILRAAYMEGFHEGQEYPANDPTSTVPAFFRKYFNG